MVFWINYLVQCIQSFIRLSSYPFTCESDTGMPESAKADAKGNEAFGSRVWSLVEKWDMNSKSSLNGIEIYRQVRLHDGAV